MNEVAITTLVSCGFPPSNLTFPNHLPLQQTKPQKHYCQPQKTIVFLLTVVVTES